MQKILVATDYSQNADNAVDYAVSLANQFGSLLSLVSAIDEPYAAAGALVSITEEMRDEAMETMGKVEARVRPMLKNRARVDRHTVDGKAGPTLARIAKAKDYDLIVMGTQGSTAAKELFTGSVANSVIKNSEVPVLAIPAGVRFAPFNKVLVAQDQGDMGASAGAGVFAEITAAYHSEVVYFHDDSDDVANGIRQAVTSAGADLLVMKYHDKGFFGGLFNESTVTKVVFDSPVALLVMR